VCCSVLQRVAACCSVLLCVAVCCSVRVCVRLCTHKYPFMSSQCVSVCCSVLQYVAACCSVLLCGALCCSVWQCVAMCGNVLQCVAVSFLHTRYSLSSKGHEPCVAVQTHTVLQCVAVRCSVFFAYPILAVERQGVYKKERRDFKRDNILQKRPMI